MEFRRSRERMVQEQLVDRGIADPKVIAAMRRVARHLFVDAGLRDRAYGDFPLPIGEGQTVSQPQMVAAMTEALRLQGHEKVLEIGTGSGYQTAVLAEIVPRVFTVERIPALSLRARELLDSLGYQGVAYRIYDGTWGWKEESPFDAIIVTAGAPSVPDKLVEQLGEGGRLVIPVGDLMSQQLLRITRRGEELVSEDLGGCVFVRLIGEFGWREER